MKKLLTTVISLVLVIVITGLFTNYRTAGNGNELYISSDKHQESEQGIVLTDQQLIDLFNVVSNYNDLYNGALTVEHDIDFNKQGTYNLKFIASYQEVLCFDDQEDADGNGTGKNQNSDIGDESTYCQNHADDGENGDNDTFKYIDKQKVEVAHLTIIAPKQELQISAANNKSGYEHTILSSQQLIDLFGVEVLGNSANQSLIVTHQIDFETPGFYDLTFSVGDVSKTVKYEVIDLKPNLDVTTEFTIKVGETIDYFTAYNINASEFADYDLNHYVKIHDSNIDFNKPGDYTFNISVSDHEGNVVIKPVTLHIVNDNVLNSKPLIIREVNVTYTDQQLKELFELTANYPLDLANVSITHNIDFRIVGMYEITFTDSAHGTTTTSEYRVVEQIERNLILDKVCTTVGDTFTKQDYIDAYAMQNGELKDSSVLNTLAIDDSHVNYNQEGRYHVTVTATNNANELLTRVIGLCVTADDKEQDSEVDSEVPEEVDPNDDGSLGPLVCSEVDNDGTKVDVLSSKISTVSIPPSDSITVTKLRTLFGQPQDAIVKHNILPNVKGTYNVLFEKEGCRAYGTVKVADSVLINNPQELEEYLDDKDLNSLDPNYVSEGDYTITVVDKETDEERIETMTYRLMTTGNDVSFSSFVLIILIGLGITGLVIRIRNN